MQEESNEVPLIPNECDTGSLNGVISFRGPQVVKGPKNTRFKNVVEKKTVKSKKKSAKKKGSDPTHSRCVFFPDGCFYNKFFMFMFCHLQERIQILLQKMEMEVLIQSN